MRNLLILISCMALLACSTSRNYQSGKPTYTRFSPTEKNLILEADSSENMRVFLITDRSDSMLLRTESMAVKPRPNDKVLQHFVRRLYNTVRHPSSMGVGIAAPQVGILKNIIWVQRFDKENFPFEVYLNPTILQYTTKKQPCPEGCLSIPDFSDTTQNRAYAIMLEYDRIDGSHQVEMVEGFTAVIFQHEIDHLNGILFTDHLKQEIEDAEKRGK